MKPGQLLIGISLFLFTAVFSMPAAGYASKEKEKVTGNYHLRLYVKKDSLQKAAYYEQLAHDLYNRKLFKRAVVQWKKVLRLQPANAFAMFMLGKSYMGMGEKKKGATLCDEAIARSCY